MDATLERRLRELLDKQEIWEVMLAYARGVDRFDREMIRNCYHDDAIEDHHAFVGLVPDFIDWALGYHGAANPVHHHGINNHSCALDGDRAHTETYYTFIGTHREAPHMLSIGRYVDRFERRDGVWRIADRVCVIEAQFALHDLPPGVAPREGAGIGPAAPATRDRDDLSYQRPIRPRRPKDAPATGG